MEAQRKFQTPAIKALSLVLLVLAVYLPALRGGFIWDDAFYLTENKIIAAPDGLQKFWFTTEPTDYYPLSNTTLWLEWRLWGMNPAPYHKTNVLLHAANALLLIGVLTRLKIRGAWVIGAAFALHPCAVEAAAWIAQRKSLLAMLFYLASIAAFLRFEDEPKSRKRWYIAALLLFAASLLSKTSQITLPLVLPLLAWWRRGKMSREDLLRAIPFLALAGAAAIATVWFQYHHSIAGKNVHPESIASRIACSGWIIIFYVAKALAPLRLAAIYPRWPVDPANALHWIPLIIVLIFAVIAWRILINGRRPLLFATAYFIIALLPVLGFLDIAFMRNSFVADHWQYGALPAILALVVAAIASIRWPVVRRVTAIAWLMALAIASQARAVVMADSGTLWRDNIANYPRVPRAWAMLGELLMETDGKFECRATLEHAVQLNPDDGYSHAHLGMLLATSEPATAEQHLREALRIMPDNIEARHNLAVVLTWLHRDREAAEQNAEVTRLQMLKAAGTK